MYCWSLVWRILSIALLSLPWVQLCGGLNILWYHFVIGMKTDLFQFCGNCWAFQIYWHIKWYCIGLGKIFLLFLSKNKKKISFSSRTSLNNVLTVLFYYLLPFSRQLPENPSFQNFVSFWVKNSSRCLLQSSRDLKYFSLKELCNNWNKWNSEGAIFGEYGE